MSDNIIFEIVNCNSLKGEDALQFTIRFAITNVLDFKIVRSAMDIKDMDKKIKKKYPYTNVGHLVLNGVELQATNRKRSSSIFLDSEIPRKSVRLSLTDTANQDKLSDNGTNSTLSKLITQYFSSLLSHHEILASDELLLFLDEEVISFVHGRQPYTHPTVHDILFAKTASTKALVHRSEEKLLTGKAGSLLVWQFNTVKFDIGFSVELNNEVKVPYTRCSSHEKPIVGTLELSPENQNEESNKDTLIKCKLKWDNSYSKLHRKELEYNASIVDVKTYENAKEEVFRLEQAHSAYELRRHTLKLELLKYAVTLSSGVHYSSSVEHEMMVLAELKAKETEENAIELQFQEAKIRSIHEEEHSQLETMKIQIEQMSEEIKQYEEEFDKSEQLLEEAVQARLSAEAARDSIYKSWKFALIQLESAMTEMKNMKAINLNISEEKTSMKMELEAAQTELKQLKSVHSNEIILLTSEKDSIISSLQQQLNANKHTNRRNSVLKELPVHKNDTNPSISML